MTNMRAISLLLFLLAQTGVAQVDPHEQWKNLFNARIDSMALAYTEQAVIVTATGSVHSTATARQQFYDSLKKSFGLIQSVSTQHRVEVTPDLRYEIVSFQSANQRQYKQLVITQRVRGQFVRQVECWGELDTETNTVVGLSEARTHWMKLCNSHRVLELVSKLYTKNAVYFNNNRVLVGTASIAAEYRYMSNPKYQLTLTPLVVMAAGQALAFEIGQCSGSYGGKYVLVWKKANNGWQVLFDSN